MEYFSNLTEIFQGIDLLLKSDPKIVLVRLLLIILGGVMIYLGKKGVLEALLMIPMRLGMCTINASRMFFDPISMVN